MGGGAPSHRQAGSLTRERVLRGGCNPSDASIGMACLYGMGVTWPTVRAGRQHVPSRAGQRAHTPQSLSECMRAAGLRPLPPPPKAPWLRGRSYGPLIWGRAQDTGMRAQRPEGGIWLRHSLHVEERVIVAVQHPLHGTAEPGPGGSKLVGPAHTPEVCRCAGCAQGGAAWQARAHAFTRTRCTHALHARAARTL